MTVAEADAIGRDVAPLADGRPCPPDNGPYLECSIQVARQASLMNKFKSFQVVAY